MMYYDVKRIYAWPLAVRTVIVIIVSLSIIYLGYLLNLSAYQMQISTNLQQEEDLKQQLKLMLNKQSAITNDIYHLPILKAKLNKWQQNIATAQEVPGLLNVILQYGETNHIKMVTFNPGKEIKDGIYYKTPVSMELAGTYDQIATFISQLANMPKLVNIDTFSLTRESEKDLSVSDSSSNPLNSDDMLSAQLDIEIYRK